MKALGNWMSSNRLRLNASATHFIWLDNGQQPNNRSSGHICWLPFLCSFDILSAILRLFLIRNHLWTPKSYMVWLHLSVAAIVGHFPFTYSCVSFCLWKAWLLQCNLCWSPLVAHALHSLIACFVHLLEFLVIFQNVNMSRMSDVLHCLPVSQRIRFRIYRLGFGGKS